MSAFKEFGKSPDLIKAIDALGGALPSLVQAKAITLIPEVAT
jgi:superfamily II DNA/RNA helicase